MPYHQIHALLIEDDPDDILLLKDSLSEIGAGKIKLDYTDRLSRGLIQLGSQSYDAILLDLNLPDSRGLDTLNTTIKRFPKIPVVVLSGLADDTITVEAVRRGAQDYLVKGDINGPLVLRVLRYAIERKQVEAVLRASEARYRTLVETSPNGISLADLEGNLVLCNQQAARLHGFENAETMIGTHFLKLVIPAHRQQAAQNTQKTLSEGTITYSEYTMLRKDGSQFPAEVSTALIRNTAGTPTGFIGITRDLSERKQAREAESQLEILKEEFFYRVSTELRAPLLSLMGFIDLLLNEKTEEPEKRAELLKRASNEASRLLDMVDELSDFSLLESKGLVLDRSPVELNQLINDVLLSLRATASKRRISLSFTPMEQSLLAEVDPARIRRVLVKLVENAIKFSDVAGKVYITGKSMNDAAVINVIDEGRGITVEECTRLFDKYYQFEHGLNQTSYNQGLGLYIAKGIVEAHGGTLTVSSQLGAGSTFILTLPLKRRN